VRHRPIIEALSEEQWLVLHDDTRHRREIRAVADRIAALVGSSAGLYAGQRQPKRPAT
jgi:hypothetical protein